MLSVLREFLARASLNGHRLAVLPEALIWYRKHLHARVTTVNSNAAATHMRVMMTYMNSELIRAVPALPELLFLTKGLELSMR